MVDGSSVHNPFLPGHLHAYAYQLKREPRYVALRFLLPSLCIRIYLVGIFCLILRVGLILGRSMLDI